MRPKSCEILQNCRYRNADLGADSRQRACAPSPPGEIGGAGSRPVVSASTGRPPPARAIAHRHDVQP